MKISKDQKYKIYQIVKYNKELFKDNELFSFIYKFFNCFQKSYFIKKDKI